MISQGRYVRYETVSDADSIYKFIHEGTPLFSNADNWSSMIAKLINHKEKTKRNYSKKSGYSNAFAHYIKILIPFEVQKKDWKVFVKKYLETVDARFKTLLWVSKFYTVNSANYAEVLLFARFVYAKPRKQEKKYNQDYFYNSETGKRCRESDEKAILKAKKGDFIRDEEGNIIFEKLDVKAVAEKVFKFKSFKKFHQKLLKKVNRTLNLMNIKFVLYKSISKITIKKTDTDVVRRSKIFRNEYIKDINDILKEYQIGIDNGKFAFAIDDIYKKFNKMTNLIDEKIHHSDEKFKKIKEFLNGWWIENIVEPLSC